MQALRPVSGYDARLLMGQQAGQDCRSIGGKMEREITCHGLQGASQNIGNNQVIRLSRRYLAVMKTACRHRRNFR